MADETQETQETGAVEGAESQQEHTENQQGNDAPPEMTRALRKANKEAETLRLKLKEFEDRDKSDLERANERAETAEKAAADHATAALRLAVAFEKGLTPAQAKRLVGSTQDELEADADEILRDFPASTSRPRGSVDQGQRGKPAAASPADEFANFIRRQIPTST